MFPLAGSGISVSKMPGSHCAHEMCAHRPQVVGRRKPPSTGHMQHRGISDTAPPVSSHTGHSHPTCAPRQNSV
jgi:hypothetical protein